MRKLKRWLYNKFLPAWCKDELLSENQRLIQANHEQRQEIERLNAYIAGMETALRATRRITIKNEVAK